MRPERPTRQASLNPAKPSLQMSTPQTMGDRVYTSDGRRRYIGLHGEVMQRPWTARRKKTRNLYTGSNDAHDVSDIEPASINPYSPALLRDIERLSKAILRELMKIQTLARFTDDGIDEDDPELQEAKRRIKKNKHSVSQALRECAMRLKKYLDQIERLNKKTTRLTVKRSKWWEGCNIFSAGKLINSFLESHVDVFRFSIR
jgi:hypothetical protein